MNEKQRTQRSKFLSLILRHEPERVGLSLDPAGWVDVGELLSACGKHGTPLTRPELEEIVATCNKKRFAFSEDKTRIRANQGHSVEVALGYTSQIPPAVLHHGTATRFLDSIRAEGLRKGERHHVHLSSDMETAVKVGQRHGKPAILTINAAVMHSAGMEFYQSDNGVWLTDQVPPEFIQFPGYVTVNR